MVVIITVNNIIVFTKQPSPERFLANLFFISNFVSFQKILAAHQKKAFRKLPQKKTHPWQSLILVRLQAFIETAT